MQREDELAENVERLEEELDLVGMLRKFRRRMMKSLDAYEDAVLEMCDPPAYEDLSDEDILADFNAFIQVEEDVE